MQKTALSKPAPQPVHSIAEAYHAARRQQLQAFLTEHLQQAQQLRNEIRAKMLARAANGDTDAVLYCLAQGW